MNLLGSAEKSVELEFKSPGTLSTGIMVPIQSRVQVSAVYPGANCTFGLDLYPHNVSPKLKVRVGVVSAAGGGVLLQLGPSMGQNAGNNWGRVEAMPLPIEDGIVSFDIW